VKKRILSILTLALLLVPVFCTMAYAVDLPDMNPLSITRTQPTPEEIDYARDFDFKTINVITEDGKHGGKFKAIEWIIQSTYAAPNVAIKYKTMAFQFKVGEYTAHVDASKGFLSPGSPGEEVLEKIIVTREALLNAYQNQGSKEAVEHALNTEAYLYISAWIAIYNDKNGNGEVDNGELIDLILNEDEIGSKASMFPAFNRTDMHSRFQEIAINVNVGPDFLVTMKDQEYKKEVTINPEPDKDINIEIDLQNISLPDITNLGAYYEGSNEWIIDPNSGGYKELTVEPNKKQTFNFTVPYPETFGPDKNGVDHSKIIVRTNIDPSNPKDLGKVMNPKEKAIDNNILIIKIVKEECDLQISGEKYYYATPGIVFPNLIK